MTHVLIAVDDTEHSLRAARAAYQLFGQDADYTVVSVSDQPTMMWGGDSLMWGVPYPMTMAPSGLVGVAAAGTGDERALAAAAVDDAIQVALDVAGRADIPHPQVVGEVGDPAAAILQAARHHRADVIVIGSHERNWFARLMSPSVADSVVKESSVPVLIAR
jgi:nucleotide-binding universal stress UspA family protein